MSFLDEGLVAGSELVAVFVFAPAGALAVPGVLAWPLGFACAELALGVSIRAVTGCACADAAASIVPDGVGVVPSEVPALF